VQSTSLATGLVRSLWNDVDLSRDLAYLVDFQLNFALGYTDLCREYHDIQPFKEVLLFEPFLNLLNGCVLFTAFPCHYSAISHQHVHMHQHIAHPPGPEPSPGIIDNISDTLLNAFSRVRKPDERFLAMREGVDKFEEDLVLAERLWNRIRGRTNGELYPTTLHFNRLFEYLRLKRRKLGIR
jgi:hypothetical protein